MARKLDELGVHQLQVKCLDVKELVPAIKKAGVKAAIDALTGPQGEARPSMRRNTVIARGKARSTPL